MKTRIILSALIALGISSPNVWAESEKANQLLRTPKPHNSENQDHIAWEEYGKDFFNQALEEKKTDKEASKELFNRSGEYYEFAAYIALKKAQENSDNEQKSISHLEKANKFFTSAEKSFNAAGNHEKKEEMQKKSETTKTEAAALVRATEEHLATFHTRLDSKRIQQIK